MPLPSGDTTRAALTTLAGTPPSPPPSPAPSSEPRRAARMRRRASFPCRGGGPVRSRSSATRAPVQRRRARDHRQADPVPEPRARDFGSLCARRRAVQLARTEALALGRCERASARPPDDAAARRRAIGAGSFSEAPLPRVPRETSPRPPRARRRRRARARARRPRRDGRAAGSVRLRVSTESSPVVFPGGGGGAEARGGLDRQAEDTMRARGRARPVDRRRRARPVPSRRQARSPPRCARRRLASHDPRTAAPSRGGTSPLRLACRRVSGRGGRPGSDSAVSPRGTRRRRPRGSFRTRRVGDPVVAAAEIEHRGVAEWPRADPPSAMPLRDAFRRSTHQRESAAARPAPASGRRAPSTIADDPRSPEPRRARRTSYSSLPTRRVSDARRFPPRGHGFRGRPEGEARTVFVSAQRSLFTALVLPRIRLWASHVRASSSCTARSLRRESLVPWLTPARALLPGPAGEVSSRRVSFILPRKAEQVPLRARTSCDDELHAPPQEQLREVEVA